MSATPRSPLSRSRSALLVTAGLAAATVLSGCAAGASGQSAAESSAASGPASATPGARDGVADLSAGLLPAEAFDAGGVAPITRDQLQQQLGVVGGAVGGVTVAPERCAQAVQGTLPTLDGLDGLAAELAKTPGSTGMTVEVLAAGDAVAGSVARLSAGVAACPQATLTAPQVGTATVTFQPVEVPPLGDGAVAVSFTTTVTGTSGQTYAVPAIVGMVQDGRRVVTLVTTYSNGAGDPVPFLALLQQAYQHQAEALG
jgi:hypothetical protein